MQQQTIAPKLKVGGAGDEKQNSWGKLDVQSNYLLKKRASSAAEN